MKNDQSKSKLKHLVESDIEDPQIDLSLRPKTLTEFIGQPKAKQAFSIMIKAAKQRKEPIEHALIYGPPGLGKTTLAHILAQEMNVNLRVTSGPAIERTGDLASILTNLEEGDILFVDEIHRLKTLYPAMEDFALDMVIGKGPSARTLRLELPKFTIVGATTRIGMLSSPLRDRFGMVYKLEYYSVDQLMEIVLRTAKFLQMEIEQLAAHKIAQRARGTPRIANKLLKRVRDVAQIKKMALISELIIHEALAMLEIDELGLDNTDRQLLKILIDKHQGGPVGLTTIAAAISEDTQTIEEVIEPYLLQRGLLKRTPRGRQVTQDAYQHLGVQPPEKSSQPRQTELNIG
jgi:Holliday junction DNA helicase RuvB